MVSIQELVDKSCIRFSQCDETFNCFIYEEDRRFKYKDAFLKLIDLIFESKKFKKIFLKFCLRDSDIEDFFGPLHGKITNGVFSNHKREALHGNPYKRSYIATIDFYLLDSDFVQKLDSFFGMFNNIYLVYSEDEDELRSFIFEHFSTREIIALCILCLYYKNNFNKGESE